MFSFAIKKTHEISRKNAISLLTFTHICHLVFTISRFKTDWKELFFLLLDIECSRKMKLFK